MGQRSWTSRETALPMVRARERMLSEVQNMDDHDIRRYHALRGA
jgi:hypothetical protein